MMGPNNICLEVKATAKPWKGGEGHNGHSGWHIVVCYKINCGDVIFVQVEIADLVGYDLDKSDWKYLGSKRNDNDSQRTETYVTTDVGTAKFRDGTVFLNKEHVTVSPQMIKARKRLEETKGLNVPKFSSFRGW